LQLTPTDYRILLASIVEARETYHALMGAGQTNTADLMHDDIIERMERLELGQYYYGHNRGTATPSNGDG
jgi:hypothetical protein